MWGGVSESGRSLFLVERGAGVGELSDRDEARAQRGRNKGKDGEKELQEQKGKVVGGSGR